MLGAYQSVIVAHSSVSGNAMMLHTVNAAAACRTTICSRKRACCLSVVELMNGAVNTIMPANADVGCSVLLHVAYRTVASSELHFRKSYVSSYYFGGVSDYADPHAQIHRDCKDSVIRWLFLLASSVPALCTPVCCRRRTTSPVWLLNGAAY